MNTETIRQHVGVYPTTHTDLAAALLALGVSLITPETSENIPSAFCVESVDKKTGAVKPIFGFNLQTRSEEWDISSADLASAWQFGKKDSRLDALLTKLIELAKEQPGSDLAAIVEELVSVIPQAIAIYISTAFSYRKQLIDRVIAAKRELDSGDGCRLRFIQHGGDSFTFFTNKTKREDFEKLASRI